MRIIHKAGKINQRGGVSAICFKSPRAINMKIASWVMRDEAVTCPNCLLKIKELKK